MQLQSEYIHAPEAARFIGIPLRTFHQYVRSGLLPSFKLGRHRLFRKVDLSKAVEDTRIATLKEVIK